MDSSRVNRAGRPVNLPKASTAARLARQRAYGFGWGLPVLGEKIISQAIGRFEVDVVSKASQLYERLDYFDPLLKNWTDLG